MWNLVRDFIQMWLEVGGKALRTKPEPEEKRKPLFRSRREKWRKLAMCTEPVDLPRAQEAVAKLYQAIRLPPPNTFVVCDSPVSGAVGVLMLQGKETVELRSFCGDEIWASARKSVETVRCAFGESIAPRLSELRKKVFCRLQRQPAPEPALLAREIWADLWTRLAPDMRQRSWQEIRDRFQEFHDPYHEGDFLYEEALFVGGLVDGWKVVSLYHKWNELRQLFTNENDERIGIGESICGMQLGAHEAHWLSSGSSLDGLIDLAHHCGWWAPYRNAAILQHRPCEIHLDQRGRLHNPKGMAVRYRDGWGIYRYHGIRVPAQLIQHPERITIKSIDRERNAEVRRVKIERYGFDRYVRDAGLEEVQRDDFGVLYRRDLRGSEPPLVFVKVINTTPEPDGSRKEYVLPVPSDVKTAHEAVARTFGLSVKEYWPSAEA